MTIMTARPVEPDEPAAVTEPGVESIQNVRRVARSTVLAPRRGPGTGPEGQHQHPDGTAAVSASLPAALSSSLDGSTSSFSSALPDRARQTVLAPRPGAGPGQCGTSVAPSLHGSRLTRRGRIVVTVAWLVLVVLAVWPVLRYGSADVGAQTASVRVSAGDTLWELAREIDPDGDPRVVVDAIIELNDLRSGGDIRPGDLLTVPVAD